VNLDGEWMLIDAAGERVEARSAQPSEANPAALSRVLIGDRYGYANPNGQLTIAPVFLCAAEFDHDLAFVMTQSGLAYINPAGGFVWHERREASKQAAGYEIEIDFRDETLTYSEGRRKVEAVCGWWGQYRIFADTIREWHTAEGVLTPVSDKERTEIVRRAVRYARENHGLMMVVEELVDAYSQAS
jgi:hypothetical protein